MRREADRPLELALPRWVLWTLVAGAAGLGLWAWFVSGFLAEPSATGRLRLLLRGWEVYSPIAALLALAAAVVGWRRGPASRLLAAAAGLAMSLSCVGAVAGVPVLLGVWSERDPTKP